MLDAPRPPARLFLEGDALLEALRAVRVGARDRLSWTTIGAAVRARAPRPSPLHLDDLVQLVLERVLGARHAIRAELVGEAVRWLDAVIASVVADEGRARAVSVAIAPVDVAELADVEASAELEHDSLRCAVAEVEQHAIAIARATRPRSGHAGTQARIALLRRVGGMRYGAIAARLGLVHLSPAVAWQWCARGAPIAIAAVERWAGDQPSDRALALAAAMRRRLGERTERRAAS